MIQKIQKEIKSIPLVGRIKCAKPNKEIHIGWLSS
jgi:hypothetical protein